MLDISLPARVIFHLGPIPVTNAVLTAFATSGFIILLTLLIRPGFRLLPSRAQVLLEMLIEYVDDQMTTAFESKDRARKFFPLIMTLLLFITFANQFSLLPLLFQIVIEGKPILRLATSDLSQTILFALMVVGLSHLIALAVSPAEHIGNYIRIMPLLRARSVGQVANALLGLFLGVLDIVGEFAKVLSLACRLFGNIFAGDVMILVIASLSKYTQFLVPMPFVFLSLFSGFVQAFVFMLLSIQFLSGAVNAAFANKNARAMKRQELAKAGIASPPEVQGASS